jgi:hypothetical protein
VYGEWSDIYTDAVYNWDFVIDSYKPGIVCSDPIVLTLPGNYTTDHKFGVIWYEYTNTTNQKQTIVTSSCDLTTINTDLYVIYDKCLVSDLTHSDDFCGLQSKVSFDLLPNASAIIAWTAEYTRSSYLWNLTVDGITSINKLNNTLQLSAFPVPVSGIVNLSQNVDLLTVTTINSQGLATFSNIDKVDMTKYPSGVYFFNAISGDKSTTIKIIKE